MITIKICENGAQCVALHVNITSNHHEAKGCLLRINGEFGQPQPVFLQDDELLKPSSIQVGNVSLRVDDQLTLSCVEQFFNYNLLKHVHEATVTCVNGSRLSVDGREVDLSELVCSSDPHISTEQTSETCYGNINFTKVGYRVAGKIRTLYESCFDRNRLEVLYVRYVQDATNAITMGNVKHPEFAVKNFYGNLDLKTLYSQPRQMQTIENLVGPNQAHKYITLKQFLSKGHLAAMSDFVFASGQRATYLYINSAPQFASFNNDNWSVLEKYLRKRIAKARYNCIMYTGTFGVTQLRDENNILRDVYLYTDGNNNQQIPVPLYYYKVAYDPSRNLSTAFVGINNPYYTLKDIAELDLKFCDDVCIGTDFQWLKWNSELIHGYTFCCTLEDFRRKVPHLPEFAVDGLLV